MNGEGLVVPVLLWAKDIDIGVDTSFRHGWEIQTQDLSRLGLVDLIVAANEGGGGRGVDDDDNVVVVRWVWKKREAQVRRVRNRRTVSKEGTH